MSNGELDAKLSKINQFLVGEISKLLLALNVEPPCKSDINKGITDKDFIFQTSNLEKLKKQFEIITSFLNFQFSNQAPKLHTERDQGYPNLHKSKAIERTFLILIPITPFLMAF